MIWIYFDWNILSNFNNSDKSHYKELRDYYKQLENNGIVSSFFTDDHLWEATNIPGEHENFEEIKISSLEIIDEFLPFYFERKKNSDDFKCFKNSAFEVFKKKESDFKKLRATFKESLYDINYTDIKKRLRLPKELSPIHLNNYTTKEVLIEINKLLNTEEVIKIFQNESELPITFAKVLDKITEQIPFFSGKKYEIITQANLLLNDLGFRKDKIGNNEFLGTWMDTHHLRNASICQLFISDDTKLRLKAKVIYDYLDIETKAVTSKNALQLLEKYA